MVQFAFVGKAALKGIASTCAGTAVVSLSRKLFKKAEQRDKRKQAQKEEKILSYVKEHELDEIIPNADGELWVNIYNIWEKRLDRETTFKAYIKSRTK